LLAAGGGLINRRIGRQARSITGRTQHGLAEVPGLGGAVPSARTQHLRKTGGRPADALLDRLQHRLAGNRAIHVEDSYFEDAEFGDEPLFFEGDDVAVLIGEAPLDQLLAALSSRFSCSRAWALAVLARVASNVVLAWPFLQFSDSITYEVYFLPPIVSSSVRVTRAFT
jgi:hypothetical protein